LLFEKPIALFSEDYAVFYPEVSKALKEMNIPFKFLKAKDIEEGNLQFFSVLIIPGGYTFKLLNLLSEKAVNEIRFFIKGGGGYIGICMGAYAASAFNLCKTKALRFYGEKMVEIEIVNPLHPVAKGYKDKILMWYQNGPEMVLKQNEEAIGIFQSGRASILSTNLEEGKIVLFSTHPEKTKETWRMLKNAIEFCSNPTMNFQL
jgi:glutamine amidotransferase-like uncharacterized protein